MWLSQNLFYCLLLTAYTASVTNLATDQLVAFVVIVKAAFDNISNLIAQNALAVNPVRNAPAVNPAPLDDGVSRRQKDEEEASQDEEDGIPPLDDDVSQRQQDEEEAAQDVEKGISPLDEDVSQKQLRRRKTFD